MPKAGPGYHQTDSLSHQKSHLFSRLVSLHTCPGMNCQRGTPCSHNPGRTWPGAPAPKKDCRRSEKGQGCLIIPSKQLGSCPAPALYYIQTRASSYPPPAPARAPGTWGTQGSSRPAPQGQAETVWQGPGPARGWGRSGWPRALSAASGTRRPSPESGWPDAGAPDT